MLQLPLGESIPPRTAHAVSVSLPTWDDNVGWATGQKSTVGKMTTGYPRFFIHKSVGDLARVIASHATYMPNPQALLFPDKRIAEWCVEFLTDKVQPRTALDSLATADLVLDFSRDAITGSVLSPLSPAITAVIFSVDVLPFARQFWQHTGTGISSRKAEFCQRLFERKILIIDPGPIGRYRRDPSPPFVNAMPFAKDICDLEWFPRAQQVKLAMRRSIARIINRGAAETGMAPRSEQRHIVTERDVYLFPTGMNAIFTVHNFLLHARGSLKSISFGFPYVDTLKILEKFGPGCVFYGRASDDDLDHLESRLRAGERFLALFCEFPGNPLLACPNLKRIRRLADQYDFAVVVDDTIGTSVNVSVLPYVDVIATSLTKFFSGKCNVTGGSAVLNPKSRYFSRLKGVAMILYEDRYWFEDAFIMEANSHDFVSRIKRINFNAEALAELLRRHPLVKRVFYPKYNPDKANYEHCRLPSGGYGGLMSVVFHREADAVMFYDKLETAKGPSLGTNFTLTSPYVVLAHMKELDWAQALGVDPYLVRISVGLEDTDLLLATFTKALETAGNVLLGH
ncbi:Cystathionine gamma-synthase [Colletotrichum spinosum]|uniref:Cystathionine gamma-synthase n=1 Tax=Colletotrichum spinosum TaxID=1347390 RepID=A0A4V3HRY0_9PEZI|nr:Cystathionine gamma-synthase [Colletotrichum spinosum]